MENVHQCFDSLGRPFRLVSLAVLPGLKIEIEEGCRNGAIDKAIQEEELSTWIYDAPSWASSILVVASPRALTSLRLSVSGECRDVRIPPTYLDYRRTTRELESELNGLLNPLGFRAETVRLPLKLLAAMSGLVWYGRNNITYLPGFGSFFQLDACYTDLPPACEPGPVRMLEACINCRACVRKCPTGVIREEEFQIHAGRCLTFLNESEKEMPGWVDAGSHHCLIGCMKCQEVCPENRAGMRDIADAGVYSERESAAILGGTPGSTDLLSGLGLTAESGLLARNLRLLFDRGDA
jgi:epoxyqueuosine reductase